MSKMVIAIPVDAEIKNELKILAKKDGRTMAGYIRHLICEIIAERKEKEC